MQSTGPVSWGTEQGAEVATGDGEARQKTFSTAGIQDPVTNASIQPEL